MPLYDARLRRRKVDSFKKVRIRTINHKDDHSNYDMRKVNQCEVGWLFNEFWFELLL